MNKNIAALSFSCLIIGFISAYVLLEQRADKSQGEAAINVIDTLSSVEERPVMSPFATKNYSRLDRLEDDLELVKQQINELEYNMQNLSSSVTVDAGARIPDVAPAANNRLTSVFNRRLYNIENLVKGGIDAAVAEDIVRRKNSIELKKLELHDFAKRENYLGTQRYIDELESINKQDVNLRDELGDEAYDNYLFNSKQNNRIKIASVMLGSTAEQVGIQQNDIVLSYDDERMFSWQELKNATSEGQLGEYVSIDIYRDGSIYSFSVPRGPLGVQLGATRLEP